ncbi:MAG: hypothetical protein L6Q95_09905, partial [Planctomycetes bacterium]|nr:hypothetical protein [Planctomycetota bacterium]
MRLAALLFVASAAACGASGATPVARPPEATSQTTAYVAVRAPVRDAPQAGSAQAIPSGAKVVRVEGTSVTVLSAGLEAAGRPDVRHDAARVLFTGRERAGAPFGVYESAPAGGGPRLLVRHPTDVASAAYLPGGPIVYSADLDEPPPAGAPAARASALFVAKGDGTAGERITWGGLDIDPTVLSDGRVLFATWRAPSDGSRSRFVLATVHPDGTGVALFHAGPASVVRPRQLPSLDIECVELPALAGTASRVALSWDAPAARGEPIVRERSGTAVGGEWESDPVPLAPRPRPQGHLSIVRADRAFGTLYCIDARRNAPGAVKARVRTMPPDGGPQRVLGDVPLMADGSIHVRVPPDTPIAFEMLDAAGNVVA